MKSLNLFILLTLGILCLESCQFLQNTKEYNKTAQSFLTHIVNEEYDESMALFATEHELFAETNLDTLKGNLSDIRQIIVNNFGDKPTLSFIGASKTFSTESDPNQIPESTDLTLQMASEKEFTNVQFVMDDTSGKIITCQLGQKKFDIPNMFLFWLVGLIALSIPIFNVYVINLIRKSNLKRKWLKYIAVFLLNVPTFTYTAMSFLEFKPTAFQILLGFGFSLMGYLSSYWSIGIPLGGLYWFWKLKIKKNNPIQTSETVPYDENLLDQFGTNEEE
ncbi:MAG: hypothetical protein P1U56_10520 [Saprospiraceae bacterium]|nr:hypothetical protein [Saprospiraceae bacterium]